MSYSELKHELETAPKTYVPALLLALVESAYRRGGIFVPGGAARLAQTAEEKAKQPERDKE